MRRVGGVAAVVVCTTVAVSSLAAQEVNLLLGGVHARYGDSLSGTAGLLGIDLGVRGRRVAVLGSMALSQFATGEWAWQANGRAVIAVPLRSSLAVGLLGGGSLNDFEGGSISGDWVTSAIASLSHRGWTFTGQAGGGLARQLDQTTLGYGTAAIDARRGLVPGITMQANVTLVTAAGVTYTDAGLQAAYERRRTTLSAGVGLRMGDIADPFGQIGAEYSASRHVTLQMSAGRYAPDLVGFQEGLYGTIGIRLRITGPHDGTPGDSPVLVQPAQDSLIAVTVRYSGPAQQVRIAGAWNGWQPMPMQAVGADRWRVVTPIPPGIHEFSLIVGDDEWVVPDGAVTVPDGFGGQVAVLVVRRQD